MKLKDLQRGQLFTFSRSSVQDYPVFRAEGNGLFLNRPRPNATVFPLSLTEEANYHQMQRNQIERERSHADDLDSD